MPGFRILLDLEEFYSDLRKKSYGYVDLAQDTIVQDVKRRIRAHFNISCDVTLVVNGYFIPESEDVRVLHEDDVIKVLKLPYISLNNTTAESDTDTVTLNMKNGKSGKSKEKKKHKELVDISAHNISESSCRKRKQKHLVETELLSVNETFSQEENTDGLYNDKQYSKKKKRKTEKKSKNTDEKDLNASNYGEIISSSPSDNETRKRKQDDHSIGFGVTENSPTIQKESPETIANIVTNKNKNLMNFNDSKSVCQKNSLCVEDEEVVSEEKNCIEHPLKASCNGQIVPDGDISGACNETSKKMPKRRRRPRKKKMLLSSVAMYVSEFEGFLPDASRRESGTTRPMKPTHVKFTSESDENDNNDSLIDGTKTKNADNAETSIPAQLKTNFDVNAQNSENSPKTPNTLWKPNSGPLIFECKKSSVHLQSTIPTAEVKSRDCSQNPQLKSTPKIDDVIAFKVLKLGQDYAPIVSEYITGKVLAFSENKKMKLLILHGSNELKVPDGKFSIDEQNCEEDKEVEMDFGDLLEVKTIYP